MPKHLARQGLQGDSAIAQGGAPARTGRASGQCGGVRLPTNGSPRAMPIRVVVEQPCLAHYRVPVFRELARRPEIELHVNYGVCPNLPNCEPAGFSASLVRSRQGLVFGREVVWNPSPWRSAASARDVLLMTWNLNHVNLVPALLRARAAGMATILWGHGYSKSETWLRKWIRERAAHLPDVLLFYSAEIRDRFLELGFPPERLHVAPNALDQAPIARAKAAWLCSAERLDFFRQVQDIRGPLLLFVSRLKPENRLDLLIVATAILRSTHPEVTTAIIGGGDAETIRLKALARELGVQDAVRFVGPLYSEDLLAPWFLSASAFCFPVNAGLSILHAFGFGVPVVTSDRHSAQNPEIEALAPGLNGLLYAHNDAEGLAHALKRLLDNPGLKQRLSAGALQTAQERSLERMVDGLEDAIRAAVVLAGARSGMRATAVSAQLSRAG
jgi:glycosyltransferase involved in cell wall biosynthesis